MKKVLFFLGAACLFTVFSSFKAVPPATVIDQHIDFTGPFGFFNPCNGEFVVADGTIGDDLHVVINNNRVNLSEHESGHLSGTGDQGNGYEVNVNAQLTENGISLQNGAVTLTEVVSEEFISKGGAPNFVVKITEKITINANGTITVDRTNFTTECRG